MPKIVDHDERRRELVEALWRVVERDGASAVSVRSVAAEAGVSKSSIGHYVGTMPQLLSLAVEELVREVQAQIAIIDIAHLDVDTATRALTALVPVSSRRRRISGVWIVLAAQSLADPEVAEILRRLNGTVGEGIDAAIGALSSNGWVHPSRDLRLESRRLHALIDGLSLESMTDPFLRSEADVLAILGDSLASLAIPAPVPSGVAVP